MTKEKAEEIAYLIQEISYVQCKIFGAEVWGKEENAVKGREMADTLRNDLINLLSENHE